MQAVLSSGSSQCCPSLFTGWAWYELENKLQTPSGTSSPRISWVCPASAPGLILRATLGSPFGLGFCFCLFNFLPSWAFWRWALRTEVSGVCAGGGSGLRQLRAERCQLSDQPSLQEPACTSDRRPVRAQQRADRASDMSGGEILFQGWLRKSPPEKKLRRYVSKPHFSGVFFFVSRWWIFGPTQRGTALQFLGVFVGHVRRCQPGIQMWPVTGAPFYPQAEHTLLPLIPNVASRCVLLSNMKRTSWSHGKISLCSLSVWITANSFCFCPLAWSRGVNA